MTCGRRRHRDGLPPARAAGRLFIALLFAFHVSFIPIHLAAERHLDHDHPLGSAVDFSLHHDEHDEDDGGDHDADSGHHIPHQASDHAMALTAPAKAPSASALVVFLPPAVTSLLVGEPAPPLPVPFFERLRPPGESPPGPQRPRAPPLA